MILGRDEIIKALKEGAIVHSGMPDPKNLKEFREWTKEFVQPASLDFPIGEYCYFVEAPHPNPRSQIRFAPAEPLDIDPRRAAKSYYSQLHLGGLPQGAVLPANHFILAHSEHVIGVGAGLAAQVSTRSTAKRWGLDVCGSAGWIDPGYCSRITLEIKNDNTRPIRIRSGGVYGQIIFFRLSAEVSPYDGHYNVKDWKPECMLPKSI